MTPITYNKGQVLKWPKFDGPYFPIFDEPNEISHERIFKQLEREDVRTNTKRIESTKESI